MASKYLGTALCILEVGLENDSNELFDNIAKEGPAVASAYIGTQSLDSATDNSAKTRMLLLVHGHFQPFFQRGGKIRIQETEKGHRKKLVYVNHTLSNCFGFSTVLCQGVDTYVSRIFNLNSP